jgi:hypothetical protein
VKLIQKAIDSDSLIFEQRLRLSSIISASWSAEFISSDDSTLADQITRKGAKVSLKSDLQPAIPGSTKQHVSRLTNPGAEEPTSYLRTWKAALGARLKLKVKSTGRHYRAKLFKRLDPLDSGIVLPFAFSRNLRGVTPVIRLK